MGRRTGCGMGVANIGSRDGGGYDAFISYSRAAGGDLAHSLQRALSRFAKPWYRRRALRVFRDDASLSTNAGLWSSIERSLAASRFLVLLASPESARSVWVDREVAYWIRNKPIGSLLIALADGEVAWDPAAGRFDAARTTALPPAALSAFPEEPRYLDLRWVHGLAETPIRDARFVAGVADLAAPMHGRAKDELFGEETRQHRRTRRLTAAVVAALSVLVVATSTASVLFVRQRDTAVAERDRAEQLARVATSRSLAAQSRDMAATLPDTALLLALESYRTEPTAESREALLHGLVSRSDVAAYLRGHTHPVAAVSFGANGFGASGDREGFIQRWKTPLGPALGPPIDTGLKQVGGLAVSPDGRTIAVAGERLALVDGQTGAVTYPLGERVGLSSSRLAFSSDGRRLAIATCLVEANECADGGISVLDMTNQQSVAAGLAAGLGATSLTISADGLLVAAGSAAGEVVVVDTRSRAVVALATDDDGHPDEVESLCFSRDGSRLRSASGTVTPEPHNTDALAKPTILTWDLATGRQIGATVELPTQSEGVLLFNIGFRPDCAEVATSGDHNIVRLWDAASGIQRDSLVGQRSNVTAAGFTADGGFLATGANDGTIIVWRPQSNDGVHNGPVRERLLAGEYQLSAAFSPDGTRLAIGGLSSIVVWDLREHRALVTIPWSPINGVDVVAFSPDGRTLAAGGDDGDVVGEVFLENERGAVTLWDAASGAALGTATVGAYINDLAFSPDGSAIAVSANDLALLDPRTMTVTQRIDTGLDIYTIAYSHDGRTLAVGDDSRNLAFLAMPGGNVIGRLQGPRDTGIFALAFSSDDRSVAFGQQPDSEETTPSLPTVHLVDVANGALTGVNFAAHADRRITGVAYSADGRVLATAGGNVSGNPYGEIALWDARTGQLLQAPITDQIEEISDLAVDPSGPGLRLAATDQDGVVVWDLDIASWQRYACEIAARDLSQEEWHRHVGTAVPYRRTCTS